MYRKKGKRTGGAKPFVASRPAPEGFKMSEMTVEEMSLESVLRYADRRDPVTRRLCETVEALREERANDEADARGGFMLVMVMMSALSFGAGVIMGVVL